MSSKGKYSEVWMHFTEDGPQRAKCKYCKSSLSMAGGSHGNLSRHLKVKHPLTPMVLERQTTTPTPTAMLLGRQDITTETISLNFESELPSTSTHVRTQQQSISQFIRRPPPVRKVEQIDRQVLKMVAKGHHALRIVEEPEFKKLIQDVSQCPGYTLPSRKTLSKNLLPSIHMDILEKIKSKIQLASAVCLTTDGWTSRTNASYIAVTAHYIDENTQLQSHLIACDEYDEIHTADNLLSFLKKVMCEFEIQNKITAIVADNAPNIQSAIRKGNWRGVGCFAHSLNLIAQTAIIKISDTVSKVKKIVEYFHKSSQGLRKLQETQKQMELPELKLKQDVITRWYSTYEMLQRIAAIKDAVISTLSLIRPELLLPLQWDLINEVIPILKPFYEVTVEISAEKSVTLSKVTVLCNLLVCFIAKSSSVNSEVSSMITSIKNEMNTRFGEYESNILYAESTILDPRFKRNGFKNDSSYENAVKILRSKICTMRLPNTTDNNDEVLPTLTSSTTEETSIWNEYDKNLIKTIRPDNNSAAAIREFDKYLNEEYLDRKKDPLIWWRGRKHIYPRIYAYALKRLCIVATSVPCERIFSATGQIINERRTLLKAERVSSLVFLHNNM